MFGERLKSLRTTHSLTLQQLADALSTTPITLSRYEREERQPDFNTLLKLANYFDVSTDYLLGLTNFKNPSSIKQYLPILEENGVLEEVLSKTDKHALQKELLSYSDLFSSDNTIVNESESEYGTDLADKLVDPKYILAHSSEKDKLELCFNIFSDISISNDDLNLYLRKSDKLPHPEHPELKLIQNINDVIKDYSIEKLEALLAVAKAINS